MFLSVNYQSENGVIHSGGRESEEERSELEPRHTMLEAGVPWARLPEMDVLLLANNKRPDMPGIPSEISHRPCRIWSLVDMEQTLHTDNIFEMIIPF